MATQFNLDYQTFWAPRPSSRPVGVAGQSHIRPPPQPKSSLLPPNHSRGMIGVSKESPDSSPRLASSRDDIIYISDEAVSDIDDASHEPFDESLPSIQAIVHSLEDAEKMGNTDDGLEQPLQRKDAHDASDRPTDSTPPEQELFNENPRSTVDMAAKCTIGVSASTSRMCTSAPTSITDGSRIGSSSCESSLRVPGSQDARGSSASADDEGTEKLSLSEMSQHVDSQIRPHASASGPQRPPSPPDDDCTRVAMTVRESPGPSPRVSTKEDSFDVCDTALGHTDTSCDQSSDETLPSGRNAVPSLEETVEIRSTFGNGEQTSNSDDEQPPEKATDDSGEREYAYDEEPRMSQMSLRARNKRSRELSANHNTGQFEVGGLHGALGDPEYCPAPGDESEVDSDRLSSDEEYASRKRRKFRAEPSKNESRGQPSAHPALTGLDQASEPVSAAQKDAMAGPIDAAFDEWILQDVVLKRTIMDGKATFLFQFDWDLCAKHRQSARKPCKQPKQQDEAKKNKGYVGLRSILIFVPNLQNGQKKHSKYGTVQG
ncbi:hypothetical protein IF1G_11046 [Cordyceps javanica]|uniref:Uncharacterized protein n=1 Tax=Cordyceps javanica TaxID=43265 RepID=A0A545VJ44_9HYPO|nr:hypothetical protein IF1G_11046 [Cordyceps javanica]TQW01751.1 hypothetical protein IF2G_10733 [Cordyceps javanica]